MLTTTEVIEAAPVLPVCLNADAEPVSRYRGLPIFELIALRTYAIDDLNELGGVVDDDDPLIHAAVDAQCDIEESIGESTITTAAEARAVLRVIHENEGPLWDLRSPAMAKQVIAYLSRVKAGS